MIKYLGAVRILCLLQALCATPSVCAGVVPERTRMIFHEGQTQRSLMLANTNTYSVVVQAWIDNGEGSQAPETVVSKMLVLPSVFRLQPGALQGLRLIYDGSPLPQDRESVSWLNIYEIPPSKARTPLAAQQIAVAMNTQIKVFYRPAGLPESAAKANVEVTFSVEGQASDWVLICRNPTPYHVSFSSLRLQLKDRTLPVTKTLDMMVAPFDKKVFRIPDFTGAGLSVVPVDYTWINDDGYSQEHSGTALVKSL